jgi:hypothetical protein
VRNAGDREEFSLDMLITFAARARQAPDILLDAA